MRIKLAAVAAGLIAALGTAAVPAGAATARAGHHHTARAHRKHRRHRRTTHPPAAVRELAGGTLHDPVWGHQGKLLTLRPGGSLTPRLSGSLRPQAIIGNDPDDPEESGCWDANAYIANSTPFPVDPQLTGGQYLGYVANWYSPDCGTNWAETVATNDPGVSGEFFYAHISDEPTNEEYWYSSSANGTYTDMTHTPTVPACADGGMDVNGVAYGTLINGACA